METNSTYSELISAIRSVSRSINNILLYQNWLKPDKLRLLEHHFRCHKIFNLEGLYFLTIEEVSLIQAYYSQNGQNGLNQN